VTLVSIFSFKGAPGVTTLACLLGAAWPVSGPVTVVEADPAGGDLAARFGLSVHSGWSSLVSSTRRSGEAPSLEPHLQELPGGLPVVVGSRGDERRAADSSEGRVVRSGPTEGVGDLGGGGGLVVVDLGRFTPGDRVSESWLACSDAALVVVRADASGAVRLRDRRDRLVDVCGGSIGVVAVGTGYSSRDMAGFAGVTPVADIPFDTPAAEVACGAAGSGRRLDRSFLWVSATRMAMTVAVQVGDRTLAADPHHPSGAPGSDRLPTRSESEPTGSDGGPVPVDAEPATGPVGRRWGRPGRPAVKHPGGTGGWARRGRTDRTAADGAEVGA